jgi:hypothetical protein
LLPTSEHSNFNELRACISWLKPNKIIPTVDCDSPEKVDSILAKLGVGKSTILPFLKSSISSFSQNVFGFFHHQKPTSAPLPVPLERNAKTFKVAAIQPETPPLSSRTVKGIETDTPPPLLSDSDDDFQGSEPQEVLSSQSVKTVVKQEEIIDVDAVDVSTQKWILIQIQQQAKAKEGKKSPHFPVHRIKKREEEVFKDGID